MDRASDYGSEGWGFNSLRARHHHMGHPAAIQELKARLTGARAVAVLTGAGISADSGVPTFRGADGLWRTYRAEDLATPEAFARDPRLVWEWYNWRRELIATKSPNAAHYALVDLERRVERFWLITQNVDGLHPAAGSQKLSEIHGNIWKVRCTQCGQVGTNRSEEHTSELQSRLHLVCRLLLEKKKQSNIRLLLHRLLLFQRLPWAIFHQTSSDLINYKRHSVKPTPIIHDG